MFGAFWWAGDGYPAHLLCRRTYACLISQRADTTGVGGEGVRAVKGTENATALVPAVGFIRVKLLLPGLLRRQSSHLVLTTTTYIIYYTRI